MSALNRVRHNAQHPAGDELARARSALHAIDAAAPRDAWVRAAMAARAAGLTESDFVAWSEGAANFVSERDCRSVWRSISPDGGIGPRTLFALAREAGWSDGTSHRHGPDKAQDGVRASRSSVTKREPAIDLRAVWEGAEEASEQHPYVARKLGLPFGLRVYRGPLTIAGQALDGALLVPAFDGAGDLQTWQAIPAEPGARKLNAPGASMAGARFIVGGALRDGEVLYLAEGVGAAWSLHQASGKPAVCCFGAGNVERVAVDLRARHPGSSIVVVADRGKESQSERIARAVVGAWVALPEDWPMNSDANDLHQRDGLGAVAALLAKPNQPEVGDWPGTGLVLDYLRTEPPALQWFARDRLLADRAHLLTGIGGSSKTRVLYHLGIGAVLGRLPWNWEVSRTGSAALLLAEDTPGGVHRTLAAMRDAMALDPREVDALAERLRVFPLAGKDSVLLQAGPGGILGESPRVAQLVAALRQLPPPLVFIGLDPALGLTQGDELNPAHQRRLGELADRLAIETGACVVMASHAAKALAGADEIGSHSSRGSGALTDAVRGEFVLRTMTAAEARTFGVADIEERKALVQLVAAKGNELAPSAFVPVWLRRVAGGVLAPADLKPQEGPVVGRRELDALQVLRRMAAVAVPQLKDWREACAAQGIVTGPTPRAREKGMERIRDALLQAGMVERGVGRGAFVPVNEVPDTLKPFPDTDTP